MEGRGKGRGVKVGGRERVRGREDEDGREGRRMEGKGRWEMNERR